MRRLTLRLSLVVVLAAGCGASGGTADDAHDAPRGDAGLLDASPASDAQGGGAVTVQSVTTDEQEQPLGIGTATPRFGWVLASAVRGQRQTAYRVLVATLPGRLGPGSADMWDSGLVSSPTQNDIVYGGEPLRSGTRYWWSVQVLDVDGNASGWSPAAWFETGLLQPSDWTSQWIAGRGAELDPVETSLTGMSWIWYPEGGAGMQMPAATRYFRAAIEVPDRPIRSAFLLATADDEITAYIDGEQVLTGNSWEVVERVDVTGQVRPGRQVLATRATNTSVGPAGLLARLRVTFTDGTVQTFDTGVAAWRSATDAPPGWERPGFDDSAWVAASTLAPVGTGPWGDRMQVDVPPPPAPLLRADFTVAGEVVRARLYYSSPGYGEVSLNGQRLDDSVLAPAWTRYDRRVQYVTRDVTAALRPGANVLGAVLGRGFYGLTTPNVWDHERAPWHGDPRLRAQLRIDYADGHAQTVVTDASWRTHDSATVADSIYSGEAYDARLEIPGWDTVATSTGSWRPVRVVAAPTATVVAAEHEPIEVVATHRAVAITNPKPGTYVFRYPVTLAGWARLRVTGARGTAITLRYGEKLRPDGTVDHDNEYVLHRDHQVDRYILRGGEPEVWEPRFSYKGFTYVQVDGFPGTPTAESVEAREVHTDVPSVGELTTSNALLNDIHRMTRQSILNNLHGLPTDTPMYEKNGWLGDALMTNETAIYNFGMQRIYRKWLDDVRDSQSAAGLVPVIAPSGGWGMWNSVEWGAAYPMIAWSSYLHYGDRSLLADHYVAIRRYTDYLASQARPDGTHTSTLGDWVPPGYHGNPPEGAVHTATAYVARVARTVSDIARVLGHVDDAERYAAFAQTTAGALNARFLDAAAGRYSTENPAGYRQTANILPLAFGLTPENARGRVLAGLVADIHQKNDHLDTGILGTRYLLSLLTASGEGALAYRIATQTTFPSWGYWVTKGATTLWEMWDDGARSHDHHMFGSIDQWFYEDLAGIRPMAPAYRELTIAPNAFGDLTSVSARIRTVRGDVASAWSRTSDAFDLDVTVPVGATATVSIPAASGLAVTESGRPAAEAPGVTFVRDVDGRAVFSVGSGTYRFHASTAAAQIRAAVEGNADLRAAVTRAALSAAQRTCIDARTTAIDVALRQALVSEARGDQRQAGAQVKKAMAARADLSIWLSRQRSVGTGDRASLQAALRTVRAATAGAAASVARWRARPGSEVRARSLPAPASSSSTRSPYAACMRSGASCRSRP